MNGMTQPTNFKLTKREREVLQRLKDGEDLTHFVPGGWMQDTDTVGGKTAWNLVRMALVSVELEVGDTTYYKINGEGKRVLADENYVPVMVRVLTEGTGTFLDGVRETK